MTDRLAPTAEAKARILALGRERLQAFLDEVPATAMRALATYLPRVDGFRPGSPAGIVRQKEALARRLSRPTANEYDFRALYMVWRTWVDETQANAPLIQSLIDELEEASDQAEGAEGKSLAVQRHTELLFGKLKEESLQNRCTREAIERFYTFSPLPESDAVRTLIAEAKLAVDVQRDATFHNLPTRLEQDEHEIKSIRADLQALVGRVDGVTGQVTELARELPGLKSAISAATSAADTARAALENKAAVQQIPDPHIAPGATSEEFKVLEERFGILRKAVEELASGLQGLNALDERVRQIAETQAATSEGHERHVENVRQLDATLEQLRRDVDALLDDRTGADRIAPVVDQLARLEERVGALAVMPVSAQPVQLAAPQASQAAPKPSPSIRCFPLGAEDGAKPLLTHTDLSAAFARSLAPLGLRSSAAQLLAEECAAGVIARQTIFLKGAFAGSVAHRLAMAVGAGASSRFPLPIGMQSSTDLYLGIEETFSRWNDRTGALVIEGLNHVPLDVTRQVIESSISPNDAVNAAGGRVAVFATLSRGLASLGIEPELFELGPVFDLDYLEWRTNPGATSSPSATYLPAANDREMFAQVTAASVPTEEALHLAKSLTTRRSPAFERNVARAYQALHLTRSDPRSVTPLHSLFYGWLLPYWSALGLSKQRVDEEFDGGKVRGAPPDARITAMFAAEFADEAGEAPP